MSSEPSGPISFAWNARQILYAALTVITVVLLFAGLYRFYMVVFLFFIAFSLKVAFDPVVTWLQRRGVRREVSMIFIYSLLALLVASLLWVLVPPLVEQSRTVAGQLPTLYASVRSNLVAQPAGLVRGIGLIMPVELSLPEVAALNRAEDAQAGASPWAMPFTMAGIMFGFASVFAMAYFWTLEGDLITRRLLLQSPVTQRENIRNVIAEVQEKINGYFRGQLILCSTIGVLSFVAYALIGVPNALLLGLLMAIFEAVPVIGPVLGAIPAVLMAASSAPDTVPWVIAAVIGIQVAESNLLVPRVMDRAVGVNAIVSLLAIAAFGALFGFAGALLAVPLAAVLQILVTRLLFEPVDANGAPGAREAFSPTQRHRWAVLQFQTQELAQDARKLARTNDNVTDNASELILDDLEAIARRLDDYLAGLEVQR